MKLDGSTILVTGASSGIGEALAPMLAAKGATVGVVAAPRRPARRNTEAVQRACSRVTYVVRRPVRHRLGGPARR